VQPQNQPVPGRIGIGKMGTALEVMAVIKLRCGGRVQRAFSTGHRLCRAGELWPALFGAQELRSPLRSPWNFGCVGSRNASWHFFGAQERRSPAFPLTLTTDAKYLTHGYRYGHSYYRRRIGSRTQAFEWHQFQWHRVTSNPDFKVTILFNVKKLQNGTR